MKRRIDLLETSTNMLLGLCVGYIILRIIGTPSTLAFTAQGVFVLTSFIRVYLVRRVFRWLGDKNDR